MTGRQKKALSALLTQPTKRAAAEAAGIGETTLRDYLKDPEFKEAYTQAFNDLVADAAKQAQRTLSPAISVLCEIMDDREQPGGVRVNAARSALEYALRISEFSGLAAKLEDLEKKYNGLAERSAEF